MAKNPSEMIELAKRAFSEAPSWMYRNSSLEGLKAEMTNPTEETKLLKLRIQSPHDVLCVRAAKWLKSSKGCAFAMHGVVATCAEIPDAMGFKAWDSYLIEVKMSRSDFLRDKKKYHKRTGEGGMGNYRFYLCPEGLLKPEDMPDGWGLLYATDRKIMVIKRPDRRASCYNSERNYLTSVMRRVFDGCPYIETKLIKKKKEQPHD